MLFMNRSENLVLILLMALSANANGASVREAVEQANDDGKEAAEVTLELISAGEHPANVTQAVADIYGSCEDISSSVSTALDGRRDFLEPVVSSVSALGECGCGADTLWSRSRLEARHRLPITRTIVELDPSMACAAVAAEAASFHHAQDSGQIMESAMRGRQPIAAHYDSFGTLDPDDPAAPTAIAYRRKSDSCADDQNLKDKFERGEYWQTFNATGVPNPTWQPNCDADEEEDEKDGPAADLLISEVSFGQKDSSFVAVYNATDQAIDLKGLGASLTVYFNGSDAPGIMIPLEGDIAPRSHHVVAGTAFNEDQVDQVESGFQLGSNDTISISPPADSYNCDGFRSVFGGALRGSSMDVEDPESHDYDHPRSLVKSKVSRLYAEEESKTPGYVVDAVGQVPLHDDDLPLPNLEDALSRQQTACQGDSNETDPFAHSQAWSTTAAGSLGQANARCGKNDNSGVLISELANGDDEKDAVEIYNAGLSPIDLDDSGYMLEIYRDGKQQPDEVIKLEGEIQPSGVFVVANNDNEDPIKDMADQLTNEVNLNDASAVLLVRREAASARVCRRAIDWVLELPEATQIFYALRPDDENEPPSVDPIASPN
jgi:hypothetical protein